MLLHKKKLVLHLTDYVNEYSGDSGKDNVLLENTIKLLLNVKIVYPTYPEFSFKFTGQLNKISGFVVHNKKANLIVDSGLKFFLVTDEHISLAFWDQMKYLPVHLYFLLDLYARIENETIQNLPIDKDILTRILQDEIWITINAFRIRSGYHYILKHPESTEEVKEKELKKIIITFLEFIQQAFPGMEKAEEISFPCGYDIHALYLTFYKLNDQDFLLRIDNLGPSEAEKYHERDGDRPLYRRPFLMTVLNAKNIANNQEIHSYLYNLCQAKYKTASYAVPEIYNDKTEENKYKFPKTEEVTNIKFPALPIQALENCPVENFMIGMKYRLWNVGGMGESLVFKWMFNEEVKYASTPHDADVFEANLKNKYECKTIAIENQLNFIVKESRQNVSLPQDLAKQPFFAQAIKEQMKQGMSSNPEFMAVLTKISDPQCSDSLRATLLPILDKLSQKEANPNAKYFLTWLAKNPNKVKGFSKAQFEHEAMDLCIRDKKVQKPIKKETIDISDLAEDKDSTSDLMETNTTYTFIRQP